MLPWPRVANVLSVAIALATRPKAVHHGEPYPCDASLISAGACSQQPQVDEYYIMEDSVNCLSNTDGMLSWICEHELSLHPDRPFWSLIDE